MIRRPPRSTRTDTLFPYTTLFRPYLRVDIGHACDYAQSIDGLSRDFKFCARHPRLGNINQLRKGTKGRVGPADELLIAIIIIECGATELHPTIKQRRPETRFIRKQAFLRHWSNLRCEDGGHDAVAPRFITLGYGNIKQAVGSDLVIDTSTPGAIGRANV